MYNSSNYPTTTLNTFELLGSKIVSVFWNHVYEKAQKLHATGQTKSITDAYKYTAQAYLEFFKHEALYKKGVTDIYTHFNNYTDVPLLSYTEFVNSVTKEFVPTDYWPGLNSSQKDKILSTALENIYKKMSEHMIDPRGLQRVIDAHDNRENIIYFQNLAMQIIIEERERFYQKFSKPVVGSSISVINDKLRSELVKALSHKKQLVEALTKATAELKLRLQQIKDLEQAKVYLIERIRKVESAPTMIAPVPVAAPSPIHTPVPMIVSVEAPAVDSLLNPNEFDPYEEIEEPSLDTFISDEPELETEQENDDMEETDAESIKLQAKLKREKRLKNAGIDNLGF